MAKGLVSSFRFFYKLLTSTIIIVVVAFVLFLDAAPSVPPTKAEYLDYADTVNPLLNDVKRVLTQNNVKHSLVVSKPQFASLLGFLQRAVPGFSAKVTLTSGRGRLALSYPINIFGITRYANVLLGLKDADKVYVDTLTLGKVPLPGNLVLDLVSWGVNQYTRSEIATLARTQVVKVVFLPGQAEVLIHPLKDFMVALKKAKGNLSMDKDEELLARVTYYLYFLAYEQSIAYAPTISLAEYLRELMLEAQIQSKPDTAHLENEAAILALAIYAGDRRFGSFIGVDNVAQERLLPKGTVLTLQNRPDLAQHFIFSAAIKILSDQGTSVAIGEFKELMDRVQTGSGYSFVDLAADKAGVHFALQLAEPKIAPEAQLLLSLAADEKVFMPKTTGLPEGLRREEFTTAFGRVDSIAYKAMVAKVVKRVNATPLASL